MLAMGHLIVQIQFHTTKIDAIDNNLDYFPDLLVVMEHLREHTLSFIDSTLLPTPF